MLAFRMIRHLLLCCVLTLACAGVLPSCDSDDVIATEEEQASEAESPKIVFTIFMMDNDSSSGISRSSTWGDTYDEEEEESDYEMYISSLNVLLYDSDDSYVTSVRQVSLSELSDSVYIYVRNNGSDVVYTYIGTIDDMSKISNPSSFTGKIMVLANCDASETSMDGLKSTTYDVSGTTDGIPMWGVTSLTDVSFKGGNINLGEIDLLRAMAKVKIKLDDDVANQGYTITEATISPYNTQGYCLPYGFEDASETGEIDRDAINVSDSWTASIDGFAFDTSENDDNAVVAYLPEYDNTSDGVTPATIAVTISSDSNKIDAKLYFGAYTNGVYDESSAYDIVRNHQYTYTLSFYPDEETDDSDDDTAEDTEGTSDVTETETETETQSNKVIDSLGKSDKVKIKGVSLRVEEI